MNLHMVRTVQFIKNLLVEPKTVPSSALHLLATYAMHRLQGQQIHKEFVASYVTVTHAKQHGHAINMHAQQKAKDAVPTSCLQEDFNCKKNCWYQDAIPRSFQLLVQPTIKLLLVVGFFKGQYRIKLLLLRIHL